MAKPRSPVSAALVCQSFAQHATTCLTAAVALVPVTTVALSAPGTTNGDADGQQLAYVYCEANRADALIGQ